jgi:hypothetical protein
VRSAGVIAHPVLVGVISGIEAKVRPVILAQSSCRRAKGEGLWSIEQRAGLNNRDQKLAVLLPLSRVGGSKGSAVRCGSSTRRGSAVALCVPKIRPWGFQGFCHAGEADIF